MIVDSSAIIAIVLSEPGYEDVVVKLRAASTRAAGTPTLVETAMVLTARTRANALGRLARFLQEAHITTAVFGEEHWKLSVDAFDRFGKGRHKAALNFGDCMTYAVAKLAGEPLLCVGDDFALTDIDIA